MKDRRLTRDDLTRALLRALEPVDFIHAFWEGGAAAFKRIDKYSDLDLYLVVDDGKVDETFQIVERTLASLSPIQQKLAVSHSQWPGLSQAFYKLNRTSEYLLVDLAVLTLDSPDKLLEPEIHGEAVFFFNKSNRVKPPQFDRGAMIKRLKERLERLKARLAMFGNFVEKEIARGNSLEAIDFYYNLVLTGLVEALRMQHKPVHYEFKMRYVHYELPPEVVKKLERLHFVRDMEDLQDKHREATMWFQKTISQIALMT